MKLLFTLSVITLLISSCGPTADPVKAPNSLFPIKRIEQFRSGKKVKTVFKSTTNLVYPNPVDLEGYSYSFDHELWERALSKIPYRNKITPHIEGSNDEKVAKIANIVSLASTIRNNLEEENHNIGKHLTELLNKYICMNPVKDPENKRITLCQYDIATPESYIVASTCRKLKKWVFKEFSEEQQIDFKKTMSACKKEEKRIKTPKKDNEKIREDAKGLVTEMLGDASEYSKIDYLFTIDEDLSSIKIDRNLTKIEKLKLFIEFNIEEDDTEYSIENGRIENLILSRDEHNILKLTFSITNDELTLLADLDVSDHPIFGVRFLGETIILRGTSFHFGIMKLEVGHE